MSAQDGGPAFPMAGTMTANGDVANYPEFGMAMRDYFAGQALAGMLANGQFRSASPPLPAREAYAIADSMLAERAK